jgi:hypothetical protein
LKELSFSIIYEILNCGSLRFESEDCLYDFINIGIETDREMFDLLEFVTLEYCLTEVMNDLSDLIPGHFTQSTYHSGRIFVPDSSFLTKPEPENSSLRQ